MSKNVYENFDVEEYKELLERAKEDGVHFVHIFDKDHHKGGCTVAWQRANPFKNCKMINVAVAYCSEEDYFCRKVGAYNVLSNAYNGQFIKVPLNNEDSAVVVNNIYNMFGE